jgi:hypothetical protein
MGQWAGERAEVVLLHDFAAELAINGECAEDFSRRDYLPAAYLATASASLSMP